MENHNEYLEYDTPSGGSSARPTFLLVICILSWISVAWNVFTSANNVTKSYDDLELEAKTAIYEMKKSSQGMTELIDQTTEFMMQGIETNTQQNYGYLFLFLLQGVAVFMMFQQKKIGFWSYLIIQVGIIGVMSYFYPWPNIFSMAAVGYRGFTSLLFVILFAVNLKHMR